MSRQPQLRKPRPTLVTLVLLAASAGGCLSGIHAAGQRADHTEWLRTQQARAELRGVVEDESGNRLRGVRVRFERDYLIAATDPCFEQRHQNGSRTVNETFHLTWAAAERVGLVFEKAGYTSVEMVAAVEKTVSKAECGHHRGAAPPVQILDLLVRLSVSPPATPIQPQAQSAPHEGRAR